MRLLLRSHKAELHLGIFLALLGVLSHRVFAFAPARLHIASSNKRISLRSSTIPEEKDDERQRLLDKAKKLRDEAQILEGEVRNKPTPASSEPQTPAIPLKVTDLKDSTWKISYRFSSQPKDDEEDVVLPNYSGKLTLLLKADGYSEIISTADDRLQIVKVWGWDEEYSQEDEQQYVLFSMDVQLPESDPKLPDTKERYYFQARIDRTTGGEISLGDGTVTVKKDVSEKTNGMWGLFQVAGILTQFRYVGDFIAKPP
jgi:hypothetical protein